MKSFISIFALLCALSLHAAPLVVGLDSTHVGARVVESVVTNVSVVTNMDYTNHVTVSSCETAGANGTYTWDGSKYNGDVDSDYRIEKLLYSGPYWYWQIAYQAGGLVAQWPEELYKDVTDPYNNTATVVVYFDQYTTNYLYTTNKLVTVRGRP